MYTDSDEGRYLLARTQVRDSPREAPEGAPIRPAFAIKSATATRHPDLTQLLMDHAELQVPPTAESLLNVREDLYSEVMTTDLTTAMQTPAEETHLGALHVALNSSEITSALPPTPMQALVEVWPQRDEVRFGVLGQLAWTPIGFLRASILGLLYGAAFVLAGTRQRTLAALIICLLVVGGFSLATAEMQ